MSRIDDALKRLAGGLVEPRPISSLDRYAPEEKGLKPDEHRVSSFAPAGPIPVEGRPPMAAPKPPAPAATLTPADAVADAGANAPPGADEDRLVDLRPIADYLGFIWGSVRRHKVLAASTFSVFLGLAFVAAIMLPRTYYVETQLLAQRNAVMTALSNPGRAVPWDADAPTRSAAETVLKRDNLLELIKKTDLVNEWDRTRVPILRFKDWLNRVAGRAPTPEEKLEQIVGLLETRLWVVAGPVGDGTVTMGITWADAEMAYRLVLAAQEAFIDARQTAERNAINESIGILERYSATLNANITETLEELQRTQRRPSAAVRTLAAGISGASGVTSVLPPVPTAALGTPELGAALDDPEILRLKDTLTSRRQEVANLEAERRRQVSDTQSRLAQLTTVYTPQHPAVLAAQQQLSALSQDSPQLATLKAQTENTEAEYLKRVASAQELLQVEQVKAEFANRTVAAQRDATARNQAAAQAAPPAATDANLPGSGSVSDFASVRLRLELSQLQSVLERTDGARIELAVSDAAFKYRYSVIRPPQVPRDPIRPNRRMIVLAGAFGSLVLALVAAAGKDLLSNRIYDRWQIERQLGLPVLGGLGSV